MVSELHRGATSSASGGDRGLFASFGAPRPPHPPEKMLGFCNPEAIPVAEEKAALTELVHPVLQQRDLPLVDPLAAVVAPPRARQGPALQFPLDVPPPPPRLVVRVPRPRALPPRVLRHPPVQHHEPRRRPPQRRAGRRGVHPREERGRDPPQGLQGHAAAVDPAEGPQPTHVGQAQRPLEAQPAGGAGRRIVRGPRAGEEGRRVNAEASQVVGRRAQVGLAQDRRFARGDVRNDASIRARGLVEAAPPPRA